ESSRTTTPLSGRDAVGREGGPADGRPWFRPRAPVAREPGDRPSIRHAMPQPRCAHRRVAGPGVAAGNGRAAAAVRPRRSGPKQDLVFAGVRSGGFAMRRSCGFSLLFLAVAGPATAEPPDLQPEVTVTA